MVKRILLATRNQHKKLELQQMLGHLDIEILTLDQIKPLPPVEENGKTFAENAIIKAARTAFLSGLTCLADDSGLVVDALDGQPGIYSARFAGENASDEENNRKLLQLMQNIPLEKRKAHFTCVIAISDTNQKTTTVEGKCAGSIAFEARGAGGFGYDPLFIPEGFNRSFAELSSEEKNKISHRGKALQKARLLIEELIKK